MWTIQYLYCMYVGSYDRINGLQCITNIFHHAILGQRKMSVFKPQFNFSSNVVVTTFPQSNPVASMLYYHSDTREDWIYYYTYAYTNKQIYNFLILYNSHEISFQSNNMQICIYHCAVKSSMFFIQHQTCEIKNADCKNTAQKLAAYVN